MFIGHYAVAMAAEPIERDTTLRLFR